MDTIRDFILPTETLNPENDGQMITARKQSAAEYSIVFASGPDFAVRRKTKAGSKVLVFLVSQSQYYIKDEKKDTIEQFSPTLYARFMADAPDRIRLEEDSGTTCNWLAEIERGKVFGDALESIIRCFNTDEAARTAATHNWLLFSAPHYMGGRSISTNIAASEQVIKKVLTVCAEYNSEEAVKASFTGLALKGNHASDKLGSALSTLLGRFSWMNNRMLPGPRPACASDMIVDAYGLSGLEDILCEYFQVGVPVFPSFAAFYKQSNCVASYVGSIIRGECMIFFCRYTAVPDKSLVTVELRADGSLGQVKARFNHAPDADAAEFVEKWYEKVVLKSELWQQAA